MGFRKRQALYIAIAADYDFMKKGKLELEKTITRDWPLFIVEMLHAGFTSEFKKQFNFSYSEVLFDCYTDHLDIYRAPSEHIEKMRSFILANLKRDAKFISKCSARLKKFYKAFISIIVKIDKKDLNSLSSKKLAGYILKFIEAHRVLEPTFVVNFWFPIQMENHILRNKWQAEIKVAAQTRAETEKVGPEGDKIATKLAQEASRRMLGDKQYGKFITINEAIDFLINGKPVVLDILKKRSRGFVYGALGVKLISLEKYARLSGVLIKKASLDKTSQNLIKGQVAFLGLTRGRARIILSKADIHKVKSGEVLITAMTTPEYLSAMKKAIAFVTDEGGVTCHAAIVARELKKPCIIGTKIATQVFKDGDSVEVDAEKGIVRKIG